MLSQEARYALHALIVLGIHWPDELLQIADISEEARVPRRLLEQILLELKKRGIVQSLRGRAGGYRIGQNPRDISFADVIRAIDGPLALAPCVSAMAYHKCDDCVDKATCSVRRVLLAARDATADVLESRSLAQVVVSARKVVWA